MHFMNTLKSYICKQNKYIKILNSNLRSRLCLTYFCVPCYSVICLPVIQSIYKVFRETGPSLDRVRRAGTGMFPDSGSKLTNLELL
jgi:hypothetical protein